MVRQVLKPERRSERLLPRDIEPVGVSLRPDDPFAKKLSSTGAQTQNVLVKITVPKRTGRKRKRGSDDPWTESGEDSSNGDAIPAPALLQRLRDNEGRCSVEAVGNIEETHRFNDPPDFQIRGEEAPIMREIRAHAMDLDYDNLKAFNINFNPEIDTLATFPAPPSFIPSTKPSRHEPELENPLIPKPRAKRKTQTATAEMECLSLPRPENLPEKPEHYIQLAIDALNKAFENRPIISMRAFNVTHPGHSHVFLGAAIPYVGHKIKSGPWADTIVKYGVDPRNDPVMRRYQTMNISTRGIANAAIPGANVAEGSKAHIFDGSHVGLGTSVFQLCDLTDPNLQKLVQTSDIRTECETEVLGWFHNATLAKIRRILRDKLIRLAESADMLKDEEYEMFLGVPEEVQKKGAISLPAEVGLPVMKLGEAIEREAIKLGKDVENGRRAVAAERGEVLDVDDESAAGSPQVETPDAGVLDGGAEDDGSLVDDAAYEEEEDL